VGLEVIAIPRFERPLEATVRETRLLCEAPWVRSLGRLEFTVTTEGWKFPAPPMIAAPATPREPKPSRQLLDAPQLPDSHPPRVKSHIRARPTA